jgi:hypothetical protein
MQKGDIMKIRILKEQGLFYPQGKRWCGWSYFYDAVDGREKKAFRTLEQAIQYITMWEKLQKELYEKPKVVWEKDQDKVREIDPWDVK